MRKASVCAVAMLLGIVSLQGRFLRPGLAGTVERGPPPQLRSAAAQSIEEDLRAGGNAHFDSHD